MANMEVFDSYFRRADLDRDGRISGAEAVAFFQGSNLPKQILAQVWMHADQNRTGFLGRAEFYNALKLVTVAQSGRELTPDIVKAALYGPAAAKIPAPQINPTPTTASQLNSMAPPQNSMGPSSVPQSFGIRGMQPLPNAGMNQQSSPSPDNKFMRPSQATSAALPMQGVVTQGLPGTVNAVGLHFTNPNISNDLSGVRPAGASTTGTSTPPIQGISPSMTQDGFGLGASIGATAGVPNRAAIPTTQEGFGLGSGLTPRPSRPQAPSFALSSVPNKPQDASLSSLQPAARDLKTSSASGNGFSQGSFFGGDVFSVSASQLKQDVPASSVSPTTTANSSAIVSVAAGPQYSSGSVPAASGSQYSSAIVPAPAGPQSSIAPAATGPQYSSAIVPPAAGPQSSTKQSQVDPFQALAMTGGGSQLQQTSSLGMQSQVDLVQRASALAAAGVPVGTNASASHESQTTWPRMTQSDIQKYMKVFAAVDTDRDGRITGEQARNLFLSWRLPREVLKQVWDLSDQDNDSMLSLREFCTALYLMERYREGHSLPGVLPDSIKFDRTLLGITGPPAPPAYGSAPWQPSPGFSQSGVSGVQAPMPGSGLRPTAQGTMFRMDAAAQPMPQKSGMPVTEKNIGNQISKEQKTLNLSLQEATEADKKNEESQKDILDSKEKIAFYRTMMQELVLYKSRCDNRLNEITERASADKREAELLAKKYEEKYKQVGETASKLTIEEAAFRELQERKMELHNAILNMEQGGSADGLLQVRADRIQSDLEELGKALNDRCKRHGLNVKSRTLIELPFGWQPGIQEGAAHWDEDWDKFEDEGFMVAKDLTDVDYNTASSRTKPSLVQRDEIVEDSFGVTSSLYDDSKMDTPSSTAARAAESSSAFDHSEDDLVRSPSGSPTPSRRSEDSSRDFTGAHFGKNMGTDSSPHAKETQSDHGGAESTISGDKYDESSWGATFDTNDDVDSVWGFNTVKTKDHEQDQSSFFGSSDFGLNPVRTESPSAEGTFLKKNSVFADSIPNTPLFNSNSPARYSEVSEDHTDHFARFDSFHTHDSGFFAQENLTRFDSIHSTRDSDHNRGHDSLARFDSIRSTRDSEHSRGFSFDDSDPFGLNAPFKSSESQTSRKSDSWSAF